MKTRTLLLVAAGLIVVGCFLMFFPFNNPETECAEDPNVTSGYVDEEKGCPVSIESAEEIRAEESRFKVERVGGLVLVVVGLGTGGLGAIRSRKSPGA